MCKNIESFLILGRGSWSGVIENALLGMGYDVSKQGGIRKSPEEAWDQYIARWQVYIDSTLRDIVWIATPPGDHVAYLASAALLADKHVIIEKPWLGTRRQTVELLELAAHRNCLVAVNYQYLFLEQVQQMAERREWLVTDDVECEMIFTIIKLARDELTVMENLGSHMFAIRQFLAEGARVSAMKLGCQTVGQRSILFRRISTKAEELVDFSRNDEPILQKFVQSFVNAARGANDWFPTLYFAQLVNENMMGHVSSRSLVLR